MRTIVAGSRRVTDYDTLVLAMAEAERHGIKPSVVLSGCAPGVDALGERWAKDRDVPIERHPARWEDLETKPCRIRIHPGTKRPYNAMAGINRNLEMAACGDALVAVWDGVSRGTMHMIASARRRGLTIYVKRV